jgi:hypothetical protein
MKAEGAEFLANGIRMKHLVKSLETRATGRESRPFHGNADAPHQQS